MAQAISTQNQNVQLTKTFIVAFGAVLLALPIVTMITTSIVQAQLGSFVHAAQAPQTNSIVAGPSCAVPTEEQEAAAEQANVDGHGFFGKVAKWLPFVGQSNYNSTSTTTTTNTSTTTTDDHSKIIVKDNGNTDNRWSGNTLGFSLTDNRWSGNTANTAITTNTDLSNRSVNTNIQDSGNTSTTNTTTVTDNSDHSVNNSGNTATNNNVNTNVNSNNTITSDNDLVDVL